MSLNPTNLLSARRIIISHPVGGLGDCLSLSTLPEMFARYGIESYLHSSNHHYNDEVRKLVWERNPYVKGTIGETPNAGICRQPGVFRSDERPAGDLTLGFIARIEALHDLPPTNRYPSIYYTPRIVPELRDKILVDVGSISVPSNPDAVLEYISYISYCYAYEYADMRQVLFGRVVAVNNIVFLSNVEKYEIGSLEHYCDVLFSCRAFITIHSGAHSLAVALRRERAAPTIHCFCPSEKYNRNHFIYDNVKYYIHP
jgi:hypothetical protein